MPLGIVVVGGRLFSLVLTLFVIPSVYAFLAKKKPPVTVSQSVQPLQAAPQ
jgi:Cu/Ag efflux pump CusA